MKISFKEQPSLNKASLARLETVILIIEEFMNQGYRLTLRLLYYQLVSRDIIPNRVQEYAKLGHLLVEGRMAGLVDWDSIEDRIRVPYLPYWARNPSDAIRDILGQYRRNRQAGQSVYIEVWVEKDALSGVLKKITSKYHVNLMVNRGYSSCSAMYESFKRLSRYEAQDIETYILYLGDHDPSGLDMIRDVRSRLEEFGVFPHIEHLALTAKQIKKYNPPPNPAKITDPRASWYLDKFGKTSWEVDALTPQVLSLFFRSEPGSHQHCRAYPMYPIRL